MRSQRGFSLIELLFALLVLTIVITTSLAVFAERTRRMQMASETILAYQALSNEAEVRRLLSYGAVGTGGNDFLSDTVIIRPLEPFTTEVKVELDEPGVKKVLLKIRWREGKREASLGLIRVDTGGTNFW
jgi:prepilin-type N-terminal cleavage/methylation domain-containing protein